jgi:hypothetical protein
VPFSIKTLSINNGVQRMGEERTAMPVGVPSSDTGPRIASDPLATPDFFPMAVNPQRNTLVFSSMSRDTLIQSPCLDRQYTALASNTILTAEIPKLLTRRPQRPLQFILHSAFCGSTLLARHFEELPHCLVLKEPQVLGQIASLKDQKRAPGNRDLWADWFQVVFAMLARGYPSDNAVVVKASSICNSLGNALLDHDGKTKIVFLYSCLRTFLLQVLKSADRRRWLGEHIGFLAGPMAQVPFLSATDAANLTDGQLASAMWLVNSFLCRSLLARPDSHRILTLDGETLVSRPRETVLAAADFLGLIADDASRAALENLQPSLRHAKDARLAYGADARAAELADAETRCGGEVSAAMAWAGNVAADWLPHSPFPIE